jgi:hypothetical protein
VERGEEDRLLSKYNRVSWGHKRAREPQKTIGLTYLNSSVVKRYLLKRMTDEESAI